MIVRVILSIYYKLSTDAGLNWEMDTRLTNSAGDSYGQFVTTSLSMAHVIWFDYRDGNPRYIISVTQPEILYQLSSPHLLQMFMVIKLI